MKNLLASVAFLASLFVSCVAYGQLTEKRLGTTSSTMGYLEYLPSGYSSTSSTKLPLILFFHGSGESGNGTTDLSKIYVTGLPRIIKDNSWTYKSRFVVLMPQHNPAKGLCMAEDEIRNFIAFARQKYNIDPSRVYLTGLSCGANGLWRYLGANPSNATVAAAVPISGNGTSAYNGAGCSITVPTWAFHGSADQTSPASNDIEANRLFQQCPAPHAEVKFTLYQGVDHNAWDRTYDLSAGNDIYAWMLTKRSPSPNQAPTEITLSSTAVSENQPAGTVVGTFATADPDANNTFTYTLEDGGTNNDKAFFTISGNVLKTNSVFDYETKSNYRIKVKSTDQGGLFTYQWFDYIKVLNVNEAPTDIALSPLEVGENLPAGTVVGTFTTTDPDAGNTFTYTLELAGTNNDISSFTIDGDKLKTNAVFHYATKSNYRIKVRSTDQGGLYDEKWFDYIKVIKAGAMTLKAAEANAVSSPQGEEDLAKVTIHPNPATSQVNIDWLASKSENVEVTVTSITSQVALHQSFTKGSPLLLNTQGLGNGIYTVSLKSTKYVARKELIISR